MTNAINELAQWQQAQRRMISIRESVLRHNPDNTDAVKAAETKLSEIASEIFKLNAIVNPYYSDDNNEQRHRKQLGKQYLGH